MSANDRVTRSTILLAAALLAVGSGCATTSAPEGWRPTPYQAQQQAYGGWIEVRYAADGAPSAVVRGELLAVESDTLYLAAGGASGVPVAIPVATVSNARLAAYDASVGVMGAWTALGTLSTLSHGFVLILSAPVWIIAGSTSTAAQSYQPIRRYPRQPWSAFRPFARFPQGMPAGTTVSAYRQK